MCKYQNGELKMLSSRMDYPTENLKIKNKIKNKNV